MAYADRYLLFVEYFNKKRFQSAQMILDEVFLDEHGADKNFYGGLIQIAVSLYHLTNDNAMGAKKIYDKARPMLASYGERHLGLNVQKFLVDLDGLFGEGFTPDKKDVDYTRLVPNLDFKAE